MTEEQRLSSKFETLSEEIVKYLFRNADAEVHRTRERNDGGYDVIVECHSGDKTNKAYFECKLRNKNLNLRDIAANVIIAFNHGVIAFVALTNHNLNPTKLSAVRSFYRMLLNPRKRLKTLGFKQVNNSFPFIRPHPLLRASRELAREKSREDIGF